MPETKYGHLVKKLKYENMDGEYMTLLAGTDLGGIDLSLTWGYRRGTGAWGSDGGIKHTHPYGECLLFSGLDYDDYNSFPAQIELTLGENEEKYMIDTPTIVVLPPGVAHCPLDTKSVEKPYGFLAISLGGQHDLAKVPGSSAPAAERKCADLVRPLELREMKLRPRGGNADYIAGWNGKNTGGFNLNFTWAFHTATGPWHERDPHVHPADEALLFVGTDPDNPDYLGRKSPSRWVKNARSISSIRLRWLSRPVDWCTAP